MNLKIGKLLVVAGVAFGASGQSVSKTQSDFVSETFGGLLVRGVTFEAFDPFDAEFGLAPGERAELVSASFRATFELSGTYSVFNNTDEVLDIADGLEVNIGVEFAGEQFSSVGLPPNVMPGMLLAPGETAEFTIDGPTEGTTVVEFDDLDLPLSSLTALTSFGLIDGSPFEPFLGGITVSVLRELTYEARIVPTPASAALLGCGGLVALRRRR